MDTSHEATKHKFWRDRLLADDPDLDEQTLADTLEGLTDRSDMLRATVRAVLQDEADTQACKALADNIYARATRLKERAEKRRAAIADTMGECGIKKLTAPDFSASLTAPHSPRLLITDEADIPSEYFEMVPKLDKRRLKDALMSGAAVRGAALGNAPMFITVRTK